MIRRYAVAARRRNLRGGAGRRRSMTFEQAVAYALEVNEASPA
jgi:hypothetical protein